MNTLWVRLTVAFTIAALASVVVVAVIANGQVSTDFKRYYMHMQDSGLVERLGAYYGQHGSWRGVESIFPGRGQGMGMMYGAPDYTLLDIDTKVVYSTVSGAAEGTRSRPDLADALPVVWQGQTVGYLLLNMPGRNGSGMAMSAPAEQFLGQVNMALWQAALFAVAFALVLGILIARGLAAPLGRLAEAARWVAGGNLDLRVSAAGPIAGTREVAGLATAFNNMAQNLRHAEQLRRDMVADIAHELRTPLTVLQGNLQAILDGVYPLDKTEIAAIHQETLVLSRLVDDLHELAQAEAGQLKLDVQVIDIAALVESVTGLFAEQASGKGISLEIDIPERALLVHADADRTRQVVHNLLANALQHTPAGGKIRVEVSHAQAPGSDKAYLHPLDSVRISVLDTGVGLSAEEMPRVFDRLWRADRSRSRLRGGSGLGLAIARYLVEGQGGRIGVDSRLGKGSTFWFTLPMEGAS
jgi:two-component system OmpR family sensor kinase/two-component system sensor histidine kinase BaeS